MPYIDEILDTEEELVTADHVGVVSGRRRIESQENNPEYSLAFIHKTFSALKYACRTFYAHIY